jgi:hypothetical protein
MKNLAGAIIVVGFVAISVAAWLCSEGRIGGGWGFLSVFTLFVWSWERG